MRIAINAVAFYAAWLAAVLFAAKGWPLASIGSCGAVIALHLWMAERSGIEAAHIVAAAVTGFALETLLLQAGLATYASGGPLDGAAPAWVVFLWMAFATLFNCSLAWLKPRLWLAIVFAFVGGPASYWAGAKLGAMELAQPVWISLGVIGVLWAIAFPSLMVLTRLTGAGDAPARET